MESIVKEYFSSRYILCIFYIFYFFFDHPITKEFKIGKNQLVDNIKKKNSKRN